jgi:hypothetical protein
MLGHESEQIQLSIATKPDIMFHLSMFGEDNTSFRVEMLHAMLTG